MPDLRSRIKFWGHAGRTSRRFKKSLATPSRAARCTAAFQGTRPSWEAVTPQRPPGLSPQRICFLETDTQTDMLPGKPRSAICVQRFDDSLSSAIHTTYRTWLRSSSMHEPRDPPLKVFLAFVSFGSRFIVSCVQQTTWRPRGKSRRLASSQQDDLQYFALVLGV